MNEWVSEWVSECHIPFYGRREDEAMSNWEIPCTHSLTHTYYMYVHVCVYLCILTAAQLLMLHMHTWHSQSVDRSFTSRCILNYMFVNKFFITTHTHTYTQFYVYNGVSACQKSCLVVLTLLLICSDFMRDCFETEPNWAVKLMKRTALMSSCN